MAKIAASVAGSVASSALSGGRGGKQTVVNELPSYISGPMQRQIGRQEPYYNESYFPYPNARIAPFSRDEQMGFSQGSAFGAAQNPFLANQLTLGAAGLNPELMQQATNPYQSQVLDMMNRYSTRNLQENVLPNIRRNFIESGQGGSSIEGDITARALRDNQQSLQDTQSKYLSDNYQNTINNFLNAGRQSAGLFAQGQQGLFAQGDLQRQMAQNNLNLQYQDFMRQQGFPMQQGQDFINLLSTAGRGQGSQTTSNKAQTNPYAQLLGAGLAGYGLYNQGAFADTPIGAPGSYVQNQPRNYSGPVYQDGWFN